MSRSHSYLNGWNRWSAVLAVALLTCWNLLGFSASVSAKLVSGEPTPSLAEAQAKLGALGLPWVPNRGQWDSRAAYRAQSFAGSVWVTTDGRLLHQFNGPRPAGCEPASQRGAKTDRPGAEAACARAGGWVLAERFVGGRIGAIHGSDEQPGRVSYQVGPEAHHANDLPSYGALDLGEVFPGVAVALKATQSNVEKLYTVAPGRDPGVIRMAIDGAERLSLGEDGRLIAQTGHGEIAFTPPIAFQHDARGERVDIPVAYRLEGDRYGFRLGAYDRSRPLVIDPLLQSTYLGGGGSDYAYALAIHPVSGEVYVAGQTGSTDLPGVAGGAQAAKATGAGDDAFVTRFNAAITVRLQSTYLGGGGADVAFALAIHPLSGEVYVAGHTFSSDLPGVAGGAQAWKAPGASQEAFVTRFNAALTVRLQSTYLGGVDADYAQALAIHPLSGEVYVAGYTDSTALPGVTGGAQAAKGAGVDAFVTRFNAALTVRLQSTYLGGGGNDQAQALAIHPLSGEVYVAGRTDSTDLPGVAGGAQAVKGAFDDAFVTRFNAALTVRLQSTYLGGFSNDYAQALAIHPLSGEVYVAGRTDSTDLPGVAGGAQAVKGVGNDAFVTRFNAALTVRLQSTYLGGVGFDSALALAIHPLSGEVYVAGETASTNLPGVAGGAQAANGAGLDAFVTRLSLDLSGAAVVPNAFALALASQFGVPTASLRVAGPVQITGLGAQAPVTVDGALGSAVCVSTSAACSCDASPGGVFGATGNIANNQYLCVRHVSASSASTFAESRVVVGGRAAKFVTFTGTLPACLLDMNGDGSLQVTQEMLVLTRAVLGFSPAEAVAGTGITEAQWNARRAELIACGNPFTP